MEGNKKNARGAAGKVLLFLAVTHPFEAAAAARQARSAAELDRVRVAFLGRKSRRVLAAYLRKRGDPGPGEPVWATSMHTRLTYTGLRDILPRRAKAAGIAAPTLHNFRRAAAILMLRGGADPVSVSRILGHGSLAVTLRYLKQEQADLAQAHDKAGPVDRLL